MSGSPGLSRRFKPASLVLKSIKALRKSTGGPPSEDASPSRRSSVCSIDPNSGEIPTDPNLLAAVISEQEQLSGIDFQFLGPLGRGVGGTVAKVLHKPTGKLMARKALPITTRDDTPRAKQRKLIERELHLLKKLSSSYVVKFEGAYIADGDLMLCLEYMDIGCLADVYEKTGPIPESIVAGIAVKILHGLCYLSDMHIVHRDIKPANILLNSAGDVKISDFGVSKELLNGSAAITYIGTQGYHAPERSSADVPITIVSDVWSLGITLIEVATGRFPYPPFHSIMDMIEYIQNMQTDLLLPSGRFSKEFESFTSACLTKKPAQRPHPSVLLKLDFCVAAVTAGLDLRTWAETVKNKIQA